MNSRILVAAGGACVLLAAGVLYLRGQRGEAPPASSQAAAPAKAETKRDLLPSGATPPQSPVSRTPEAEKLSDEQRKVILAKIEEASVTYDPKGLPLLEPYLLHPDPEVRSAALNGIIVLGEPGAAPVLREAARKAATPKEAAALTEAADYLELPAGTFIPAERTAAGTRVPNSGDADKRSRTKLGNLSRPKGGAESVR